jgi:N4-(beta-N-acetylglucosaminyl)-L-asparaginase
LQDRFTRRSFLNASAVAATGAVAAAGTAYGFQPPAQSSAPKAGLEGDSGDSHRGPVLICSGNGLPATAKAMELMTAGTYILDAIVEGIKIVENDPNDMSVGYGGLPNEEGVVQLDASVMDGPTHRAGSVGAIENIKNPAAVALLVMRRTDHAMLVGPGALKFALRMGFQEENLLTDRAREEWLKWRANLNPNDKWLDDGQVLKPGAVPGGNPTPSAMADVKHTWGTIHCSGVDTKGNVAACTSTSGLSWKLPGRLGDSPIIGAGMYCDNDIGSAGATGRGESVIQVCGSFAIVELMGRGLTPTEACLTVAKRMADKTKEKRLLDGKGRPNFNVTLYATRKDGAYGCANLLPGGNFVVHDGKENRQLRPPALFA